VHSNKFIANLNPKIFEMFNRDREERRIEAENRGESNKDKKSIKNAKRHINIASSNPLQDTDFKKNKKKKAKPRNSLQEKERAEN